MSQPDADQEARLAAARDRPADFVLADPRATVESSGADAPGPIADAASDGLARAFALAEGPGTVIGPYKLLRDIGEGGMGIVFLAEQDKPIRRQVALKVIKPGMDTRQVVARFEAERQALALMDHPNIARVLDAGATSTGRPYFVMELVQGLPITEYCDRHHLTPRERLELFLPVCRAIQHAHQKGIVHRDIKPNNVLVALHDGVPEPRVIDFGVAKATERRLTERTMVTELGAIVGTLEYMSPEQAEMGALDIDTRSDIYSLGVLLYELLTGSTPLEHAKLAQAAYSEVLRRIREEEPAKPSTRLSDSREALASISARRRTEPARLPKLIRGDLDWVVMKALDKDRTRRYETANGLARDLQRHLDGDAVEAGPPSARYRLGKFARKNGAGLAVAGAFALLLVLATTVSAGLAFWANGERLRATVAESRAEVQLDRALAAERRARQDRDRAVGAEAATKKQQERAQRRERSAIDAVKRFGDVVQGDAELKDNPGLGPLRKRLLDEPHAFFDMLWTQLEADPDTTPESLDLLADASEALGNYVTQIGDQASALKAHQRAKTISQRLVQLYPKDLHHRGSLADSYMEIARLQRAAGQFDEATQSYEESRRIRERLDEEEPKQLLHLSRLVTTHRELGQLYDQVGRPDPALASLERSWEVCERMMLARTESTEYQNILRDAMLGAQGAIAEFRWQAARPAGASPLYERSLAFCRRLAAELEKEPGFRYRLAAISNEAGSDHLTAGHRAEALAALQGARVACARLAREHPRVVAGRMMLARTDFVIAAVLRESGDPGAELEALEEALAALEVSDGEALPQKGHLEILLDCLELAAEARERAGRGEAANEARRRATTIRERMDRDPAWRGTMARLEAVRAGQPARSDAERIQLAEAAHLRAHYATATRLHAEALSDHDPTPDEGRRPPSRYIAARDAALAGAGLDQGPDPPDGAGRARHRILALGWLRADLESWRRTARGEATAHRSQVAPVLRRWKQTPDLAGVRDEAKLAELPRAEREQWEQLWAAVDALLAQVKAAVPG